MNRSTVKSSHISSAGHDPKTLTMELEFSDKSVYQYPHTPSATFLSFMSSPSKGQFFNRNFAHAKAVPISKPPPAQLAQNQPQDQGPQSQ